MTESPNLLADYVRTGSDAAFHELVNRYVDLVYSTALRLVDGDSHRAQDVAQTVFVDLARMARTLSNDVMLGGWLHRHTCFVAANTMRGERRRQIRERHAVEMNALDSGADFSLVAPILDDAINELGEADRTAILLRFFEQHDFNSVGQALGSNEDAARMRVSRALDKLEALLKRRGVTTGAAALSVALAANCVHAAPAGLGATISTAAIAGTTLASTTTATAIKTVAMTTLQKTFVAAVIAAALGTGIYQARQASMLRDENQSLQQQQATLAAQVQDLQQARNDATNRLALLADENAQLKSSQKTAELLKLRGQVGVLRQSLSNSPPAAPATGIAKLMTDPAMKEYIHQVQLNMIKERYTPLFKTLNLSPEDADKFTQLVGDLWLKGSDMGSTLTQGKADPAAAREAMTNVYTEIDGQLKSLLGPAGYAQYSEFNQETPGRTTVKMLGDHLGSEPLTDDQQARLIQAVRAEPYDATHGIAGELDSALFGSPEDIDKHFQQVTESNQRILDKASKFLTPTQLSALAELQSNSINAQKAQGVALTQKH